MGWQSQHWAILLTNVLGQGIGGGYQQPRIDLRLAPYRQGVVLLNRAVGGGDGGSLAEEEVAVSVGGRDLESNWDLHY